MESSLFWTIPQIMEKYGLTRSDLLNLIEINQGNVKGVTKGKQTKYLANDIRKMMKEFTNELS